MRTAQLDADNRREPRTTHYCVRCHKDLIPGQPFRMVHLIAGGAQVLHPEDEALYQNDGGDMYWFPIGNDCAKKVGLDFTTTYKAWAERPAR